MKHINLPKDYDPKNPKRLERAVEDARRKREEKEFNRDLAIIAWIVMAVYILWLVL